MHWKGLRLVADSSKRQSPSDPQPHGRRSEHLPRPSPPETEPRLSDSTARGTGIPQEDGAVDAGSTLELPETGDGDHEEQPGAAGPSQGTAPSMRRHRFSFMRFRHASDPQLSKSYAQAEQDTPPVPSLPRE